MKNALEEDRKDPITNLVPGRHLTLLQVYPGRRASKRFGLNPRHSDSLSSAVVAQPYDDMMFFRVAGILPIESLVDLYTVIASGAERQVLAIRGYPQTSELDSLARIPHPSSRRGQKLLSHTTLPGKDPADFLLIHHVCRLQYNDYDMTGVWTDRGNTWVMLDFDDAPIESDPLTEEGVEEAIARFLPPWFHQASYVYQYSASAGILELPKSTLRVHLFFHLDRPFKNFELKAIFHKFFREVGFTERNDKRRIDLSLFSPNQPHFIAAADYGGGLINDIQTDAVTDLLGERRWGLVSKANDSVTIDHGLTVEELQEYAVTSFRGTKELDEAEQSDLTRAFAQAFQELRGVAWGPERRARGGFSSPCIHPHKSNNPSTFHIWVDDTNQPQCYCHAAGCEFHFEKGTSAEAARALVDKARQLYRAAGHERGVSPQRKHQVLKSLFFQSTGQEHVLKENEFLLHLVEDGRLRLPYLNALTDIVASTGTGKSVLTSDLHKQGYSVLYLVPYRRLVDQECKRFSDQDIGVAHYKQPSRDNVNAQAYFCCIDSAHQGNAPLNNWVKRQHFLRKKIVVVLDEIDTITRTLLTKDLLYLFEAFLREAVGDISLLTLTATPTHYSGELLKRWAAQFTLAHHHHRFVVDRPKVPATVYVYGGSQTARADKILFICDLITKAVADGKMILVIDQSKNEIEKYIAPALQSNSAVNLSVFTSTTGQASNLAEKIAEGKLKVTRSRKHLKDLLQGPTEAPAQELCDVCLGSPSLATGSSFDLPLGLFLFVVEDTVVSATSFEQSLARMRTHVDENKTCPVIVLVRARDEFDDPDQWQTYHAFFRQEDRYLGEWIQRINLQKDKSELFTKYLSQLYAKIGRGLILFNGEDFSIARSVEAMRAHIDAEVKMCRRFGGYYIAEYLAQADALSTTRLDPRFQPVPSRDDSDPAKSDLLETMRETLESEKAWLTLQQRLPTYRAYIEQQQRLKHLDSVGYDQDAVDAIRAALRLTEAYWLGIEVKPDTHTLRTLTAEVEKARRSPLPILAWTATLIENGVTTAAEINRAIGYSTSRRIATSIAHTVGVDLGQQIGALLRDCAGCAVRELADAIGRLIEDLRGEQPPAYAELQQELGYNVKIAGVKNRIWNAVGIVTRRSSKRITNADGTKATETIYVPVERRPVQWHPSAEGEGDTALIGIDAMQQGIVFGGGLPRWAIDLGEFHRRAAEETADGATLIDDHAEEDDAFAAWKELVRKARADML